MTARMLHLAADFTLPLDVVTETNAVLGKKGSGKTSAGVLLFEQMYALGVPVVAVDPKGDWYGIRSSSDGTTAGLPIPVFGGRHGDIPLESTAGAFMADLILEKRLSCVLDVSEMSGAEVARFLAAFADRLYRQAVDEPMHLFLEECHEYIPQVVSKEDARMVGAWARIVKNGRFKGIGVTMMTQRAASLNKNVLTQADNLFALRTIAVQDRAAVKGWVDTHEQSKEILDSLPGLSTGECWLWQPQRGEPAHFQFGMRTTFDAGRTPKVGETRKPPTTLADVDLTALRDAMAATIEKAKGEDPKELRRLLAEATRQLGEQQAVSIRLQQEKLNAPPETRTVEIVPDSAIELFEEVLTDARFWLERVEKARADWEAAVENFAFLIRNVRPTTPGAEPWPRADVKPFVDQVQADIKVLAAATLPSPPPVNNRVTNQVSDGEVKLGRAERAILAVLATHAVNGSLRSQQVSLLSGYSIKSSSYQNALGKLRSNALAVGGKEAISITPAGLELLGEFDPLPSGRALIDHWSGSLGKAERTLLLALIEVWPKGYDNQSLSEATGYSAQSSSFQNALGRLRSLELVHGDRTGNFASDVLGQANQ